MKFVLEMRENLVQELKLLGVQEVKDKVVNHLLQEAWILVSYCSDGEGHIRSVIYEYAAQRSPFLMTAVHVVIAWIKDTDCKILVAPAIPVNNPKERATRTDGPLRVVGTKSGEIRNNYFESLQTTGRNKDQLEFDYEVQEKEEPRSRRPVYGDVMEVTGTPRYSEDPHGKDAE